ncbi:MAG: glycosyltransferase family 4 protein, partial [Anaerolineae bacterium]
MADVPTVKQHQYIILHLVASSRGGGAVHVRDLALGLDPTRFTVQVAMPEDGGNVRREDFETAGLPFHQVDIAAGFSLRALRHIRRLAAGVDILHVHGARAALFGRLAAVSLGRRRPRIVYTIHGFAAPHYPPPRRALLLVIERALAPFTDRFIAVCHAEREAILSAGVARPEQVRVVWNGIDTKRFSEVEVDRAMQRVALGIPPDATVIITVSRLYKPRDFDTLLLAFQRVAAAHPDTQLLIVGDGPYRPQVERLIGELGLASRVKLAGFRRDIPQLLAASDIFALSTAFWEGLPLTVLEAMAAGLPVVTSDVGGIREAVIPQETGILVSPGDFAAFSEALQELLTDRPKARAMGLRGRQRVQTFFTVERMVGETVALYE